MCYKGIQEDIDQLIKEGWVRVVETHQGNKRTSGSTFKIYFPRDISKRGDDQVEWQIYDDIELPENCLNYLANEWKDIAENESKKDWREIIT